MEKVPGSIVQEESSFDRDQRAEEDGVRNWGGFEGGREMVEIDAKEEPLKKSSDEYQVDHQLRHLVVGRYLPQPPGWEE